MPNGVTFSFQVCLYSIEPPVANRSFNLFTKDRVRATLADEPEELGPEVTFVRVAFLFPGSRVRLARATPRPDWPICWPSGEPESVIPSANSCKEMAPGKSSNVIWRNIRNAPFVNLAWLDLAGISKFTKPCGRVPVELVVINWHLLFRFLGKLAEELSPIFAFHFVVIPFNLCLLVPTFFVDKFFSWSDSAEHVTDQNAHQADHSARKCIDKRDHRDSP